MQNRPKGPRTSCQIQSCRCQDSSPALSYRDTLVNIQALPRSTLTVGRWPSHLLLHLQARISHCFDTRNFQNLSPFSSTPHSHFILLVTQAAITHTQARSPFFISLPITQVPSPISFISSSLSNLHRQDQPANFSALPSYRIIHSPSQGPERLSAPFHTLTNTFFICESEPASQTPPESHLRPAWGSVSS